MSMNTTYNEFTAVVLSDTVDLVKRSDSLYVGAGGDLVAVAQNGTATTFVDVPTGAILPLVVKRVNNTSTTAASIVSLNAV